MPEIASYRTLLAPGSSPGAGESTVTGATVPRRANLVSTMCYLHLHGATSRSDLVVGLGLSRSSVGSLLGELLETGVVREAGVDRQPSPGRPSLVVELVAERAVGLAIEIGPGEVAVATVGLGGGIIDITRRRVPERDLDVADAVAVAQQLVADQLRDPDARTGIAGVGVAVAGLVSSDGILQLAPNLSWGLTDLRGLLGEALPGLPVQVGNESTLAAVGEYLRGSLRGVENGLMITGNAGVGGGAIVNGRLLAGARGLAAEVGHMKVDIDGDRCGCGATGCWETKVGLPALIRASGVDLDALLPDLEPVEALAMLAAEGHPEVRAALLDGARWMGLGLANLVNLFNPDRIVVGGRLARLLPHIRPALEDTLRAAALPASLADCSLIEPALGKDAALIGAAEQVLWGVLNAPDSLLSTR